MPDTFGFYERLKVEEYYELFLSLYGLYGSSRARRVDEVLDLIDLGKDRHELIGTLPVEKLAFLSLGQTILHSPDWIFLDEPFNVMGSADRNRMARILLLLQEAGTSILVNTNMYQELADLFTHVAILEEGRLMTIGRPNDVYKHVINGQPFRMQVIDGMDQAIGE